MDSIFNLRRAWNWTVIGLTSGLGLAAFFVPITAPLVGVAIVVATGGRFISNYIQSREEKVELARKKLTASLLHDIDRIERDTQRDLLRWFDTELVDQHVIGLLDDMVGVSSGLSELADAQRKLAWTLNRRHKRLNRALVDEALTQLNADSIKGHVIDVARLPGHGVMLKIGAQTTIDGRIREGLEALLGEQLWIVVDTKNKSSLLAQAIGPECNRNAIKIQGAIRVAHVSLENPGPQLGVRVQLAKQLTGLHVIQ